MLPCGLFIPYLLQFPVSSAYIFTLVKRRWGVGHSWEHYILLSQVQLLRVTVSQSIWLCAYLGIPFNPCLKLIFCISTSPVYLMKQLVALLAQSYTIVNGKAFVNESFYRFTDFAQFSQVDYATRWPRDLTSQPEMPGGLS